MNGYPEFLGWPDAAPALLAGLVDHNRADAWDARHEAAVRRPALALAAALADEFGPVRVFRPRINRRFRPAAPPLRTDTGGIARSPGGCVRAVVLTASTLSVTAGHRRFDAGQTGRYRAAVAGDVAGDPPGPRVAVGPPDPGERLAAVLAELAGAGLLPDPVGELRGRPRGWGARHPRITLLRRCGLQVGCTWEVGPWLATPEPLTRVREAWRAASPLVAWLDAHVGPPAPPGPRPRPARPEPVAADGGAGC